MKSEDNYQIIEFYQRPSNAAEPTYHEENEDEEGLTLRNKPTPEVMLPQENLYSRPAQPRH